MAAEPATAPSSVAQLRETFRHAQPGAVGIEEEVMLLDAGSLDLHAGAGDVLAATGHDPRFKSELPASQLEIVLPPMGSAAEVAGHLLAARRDLAGHAAAAGCVLAGAGVHPFTDGEGVLNDGPRYTAIAEEFAGIARRQLVFGLHVHVSMDGPDEALAVYNAVREHLPALAALSAGSPFYEGRDTGLASVRPKVNDLLPRQGVPPVLESWEAVAGMHDWGSATGAVPDAGQWWWETRLHPVHGTVEVRVCDTQATVADTAALIATVHALLTMLGAHHRAGALPSPAPTWRIEENRWSACRYGVTGRWFDPRDAATRAMADHLHTLLDELEPFAAPGALHHARTLIDDPRPARLRAAAGAGAPEGLRDAVRGLADAFLEPPA